MKFKLYDRYAKSKQNFLQDLLNFLQSDRLKLSFIVESDSITITYKTFTLNFSLSKNVYEFSNLRITRNSTNEFILEKTNANTSNMLDVEDIAAIAILVTKAKEIYLVIEEQTTQKLAIALIIVFVLFYLLLKK